MVGLIVVLAGVSVRASANAAHLVVHVGLQAPLIIADTLRNSSWLTTRLSSRAVTADRARVRMTIASDRVSCLNSSDSSARHHASVFDCTLVKPSSRVMSWQSESNCSRCSCRASKDHAVDASPANAV